MYPHPSGLLQDGYAPYGETASKQRLVEWDSHVERMTTNKIDDY